jgi:hypothetical protein
VVVKGPPANGSMYPAKPPRAVVDAGTCKTVGWGAAVVKMGARPTMESAMARAENESG